MASRFSPTRLSRPICGSSVWFIMREYCDEALPELQAFDRPRLQGRRSVNDYPAAENGSDNSLLVAHRPIGANDITENKMQSAASNQSGSSDVLLPNLSIRVYKNQ